MAAAAGMFAIERIAGEAIAVFAARIIALCNNANVTIGSGSQVNYIGYNVPTFSVESEVAAGAGDLAVVALDRAAGEAIGIGTAAGGDVGFCGRIRVALAVPVLVAGTTCFVDTAPLGLPPALVYDPPTFMCFYTAAGVGNALEVQGADNAAATVEAVPVPQVAPAAWANAILWNVTSKAGHTIYIGN